MRQSSSYQASSRVVRWRREVGVALGGLIAGVTLGAGALFATGRADVSTAEQLPLEVQPAMQQAQLIEPVNVDQRGVYRAKVWACSGRSFGTAFATERGVVTAAHVIEGATVVALDDGPGPADSGAVAIGTAAVLERAEVADGLDAALLSAVPVSPDHPPYAIRDDEPVVGEAVALVGHPAGGRREVRVGSVVGYGSGAVFGVDAERIMIVSVAADRGFSGGPVLDVDGKVVAVIIGVETNTQTAVAVPIADVFAGLANARPVPAMGCDTP